MKYYGYRVTYKDYRNQLKQITVFVTTQSWVKAKKRARDYHNIAANRIKKVRFCSC